MGLLLHAAPHPVWTKFSIILGYNAFLMSWHDVTLKVYIKAYLNKQKRGPVKSQVCYWYGRILTTKNWGEVFPIFVKANQQRLSAFGCWGTHSSCTSCKPHYLSSISNGASSCISYQPPIKFITQSDLPCESPSNFCQYFAHTGQ